MPDNISKVADSAAAQQVYDQFLTAIKRDGGFTAEAAQAILDNVMGDGVVSKDEVAGAQLILEKMESTVTYNRAQAGALEDEKKAVEDDILARSATLVDGATVSAGEIMTARQRLQELEKQLDNTVAVLGLATEYRDQAQRLLAGIQDAQTRFQEKAQQRQQYIQYKLQADVDAMQKALSYSALDWTIVDFWEGKEVHELLNGANEQGALAEAMTELARRDSGKYLNRLVSNSSAERLSDLARMCNEQLSPADRQVIWSAADSDAKAELKKRGLEQ